MNAIRRRRSGFAAVVVIAVGIGIGIGISLTLAGCGVQVEARPTRTPAEATQPRVQSEATQVQAPAQDEIQRLDVEKIVLDSTLTNPTEIDVTSDGRVLIAERGGALKIWDPSMDTTHTAGFFPSSSMRNDGFLGLTIDPDFDANGWAYLHYAPEGGEPRNRVSRVTVRGTRVVPSSETVLLEWQTQREDCCHAGGSMAFGPHGNLFIGTGDNTHNGADEFYAPIDERPGRTIHDAQRTAANTNDLRGKILRIRPLPDGTYDIPDGNLYPPGTPGTRPEIYVMGVRNAFRLSVDQETGWLFWGDVGPGAVAPRDDRGPAGHDELNIAQESGNFGWPYFVADNKPFRDRDFGSEVVRDFVDPARPINDSPNNTGRKALKPAQPAAIWYPHGPSEEFPILGAGGQTIMAGPLYRYDGESVHPRGLPERFDGHLIFYDWMRNWIMNVAVNGDGSLGDIEPFLPDVGTVRPMDLELGPDGRLYLLEWGQQYNGYNLDARLVRLDIHDGGAEPQESPRTTSRSAPTDSGTRAAAIDAAASEADTKSTAISWPPDGFVFDYDQPITYAVDDGRDTGGRISGGDVHVALTLLCDSHVHPLDTLHGRANTIHIPPSPTHSGYTIRRNEAVVLEAFYDRDASIEETLPESTLSAESSSRTTANRQAIDRIVLQPRRKQAEHFTSRKMAERRPVDLVRDAASVRTVMDISDGGYLAYAPINLTNVSAIVLRLQMEPSGTVDVRIDGPQGRLLGSARLDDLHGRPRESAESSIMTERAEGQPTGLASEDASGVDSSQTDTWIDVAVEIDNPGGTHALYLVYRGPMEEEDDDPGEEDGDLEEAAAHSGEAAGHTKEAAGHTEEDAAPSREEARQEGAGDSEAESDVPEAVVVLDWIEFVTDSDPHGARPPR